LGEPYAYGYVSLAVRAELPDGTRAVLKVSFPHRESEHEADALAHWGGRGAVRLLDYDRERRALLLERCEPGTTLLYLGDEDESFRLAAGVLRRLGRAPAPGHSFRPIALDAARWVELLPERWERLGRPYERRLLDEAVAAFVKGLGIDQFNDLIHYYLAMAYEKKDMVFHAIDHYEKAIQINPEFYDAITALASLYQKQEFWRKAVEMWELALAATKDEAVRARIKDHLLSLL
jgi:tetratricopeptide (TPR) repeat protein